eukprot:scaffold24393_cov112-Isochrysis_galbana.AAC.4
MARRASADGSSHRMRSNVSIGSRMMLSLVSTLCVTHFSCDGWGKRVWESAGKGQIGCSEHKPRLTS